MLTMMPTPSQSAIARLNIAKVSMPDILALAVAFPHSRKHTIYIYCVRWCVEVELKPVADWQSALDHELRVRTLAAMSLL